MQGCQAACSQSGNVCRSRERRDRERDRDRIRSTEKDRHRTRDREREKDRDREKDRHKDRKRRSRSRSIQRSAKKAAPDTDKKASSHGKDKHASASVSKVDGKATDGATDPETPKAGQISPAQAGEAALVNSQESSDAANGVQPLGQQVNGVAEDTAEDNTGTASKAAGGDAATPAALGNGIVDLGPEAKPSDTADPTPGARRQSLSPSASPGRSRSPAQRGSKSLSGSRSPMKSQSPGRRRRGSRSRSPLLSRSPDRGRRTSRSK